LSKVRIFEGWCENGDRLLQVIKVNGRPLALARSMLRIGATQVGGGHTTRLAHRGAGEAMWLDLPIDTYIGHSRPLSLDPTGRAREVFFLRIGAQCRHERLSIPANWLIRELQAGTTKRIITNRIRMEMGARPRGE
jgi:hypothetical protein